MMDLGEARWILGMEIECDRANRKMTLSHRQYIEDILERDGMANCRPVSTPIEANLKLPKISAAEVNVTEYQRMLGSIMYAMLGTRPDLAYAVGTLSQYSACPGEQHLHALKRVFRYLRGTSDTQLTFSGRDKSTQSPICYADADWASDPNDRRSISGYTFVFCGGAISWSSWKQHSTALSSTEAEYMAASNATKEALWLRSFLSELGQPEVSEGTPLLIDNQSAIALIKNSTFHDHTKHIAVRYHFIRERYEAGEIAMIYVPTGDQVADILMKGLAREKHNRFSRLMGLDLD